MCLNVLEKVVEGNHANMAMRKSFIATVDAVIEILID
jgi:hypothetical protein